MNSGAPVEAPLGAVSGVPLAGPLTAYAKFQFRDGLWRATVPVLIFLGIGGIPIWSLASQRSLAAMRQGGEAQAMVVAIYTQTMSLSMTLGALMLVSGFVALDRERQHFRFLFSTPVEPWRYYLQQYAISALLFVAIFSLVPLGFGLVVTSVPIVAVTKSAALYALLFGSLALLCGALVNRDGVVLIVTLVGGTVLQRLAEAEMLPRLAAGVARALPPFIVADDVRSRWLAGGALEGNGVALVIAYSLAMLVVALWLIRRAPLAR